MTDARRAPRLNLVQMTEQIESRPTAAIVQLTLRQNSEDCALTSVHVTKHRKPKVNKLQCRKSMLNESTQYKHFLTVIILF